MHSMRHLLMQSDLGMSACLIRLLVELPDFSHFTYSKVFFATQLNCKQKKRLEEEIAAAEKLIQ